MRKFQKFFYDLLKVTEDIDPVILKSSIGDSVHNNRVISVNQLVRYLTTSKNRGDKVTGKRLEKVHNKLLKNYITFGSRPFRKVKRNDAVDINEFIKEYRNTVMNSKVFRHSVNNILEKVR